MPCLLLRFGGWAGGLMSEGWLANGGSTGGEFGLRQLTSLEMASPLTGRSQSAPGVICTKSLNTLTHPSLLCVLLKIYIHLNSEPGEKNVFLGSKRERESREGASAAVGDRNYQRCRARFAHGSTVPRTICTLPRAHLSKLPD